MRKATFLFAFLVVLVSIAACTLLYRRHVETPYTMAWDMSAHTYHAAELAQDIRLCRPIPFLRHINSSSIALWPFLHPLILGVFFAIFGFAENVAVVATLAFSVLTVLAAFVMARLAAGRRSVVPGLLAAFLLLTSPLYLGFSTYIMLEIMGAFFTLVTIGLVTSSAQSSSPRLGILAAVALLLLFLTKINYGLYLLVPYLIHEAISLPRDKRREYLRLFGGFLDLKNVKSVLNILIILNIIAIIFMMFSSGFDLRMFGRSVELRGTKNLIYVLVCLVFLKTIVFYFRNRVVLREKLLPSHMNIIHIVIAPIFVWFLLSPGRTAELLRMSSDRLSGLPLISASNLVFYPLSFIREYCCHMFVGIGALILVVIAAVRWRDNPPIVRLLIIYVAFGYVGLTLKLRNFAEPRFFFTQAAAILLVAAFELWRMAALIRRFGRLHTAIHYSAIGIAVILIAVFPARHMYTREMQEIILRSTSTGDPRLSKLVERTIDQINPDHRRITILGGSNEISPDLVRWQLVKTYPSVGFDLLVPPGKALKTEKDVAQFETWVSERHADAIICIAVRPSSPFAQTPDFKSRHRDKQKPVDRMERQDVYTKIAEERWEAKAIELRLYTPASRRRSKGEE